MPSWANRESPPEKAPLEVRKDPASSVITPEKLVGLPDPVQRYLRYSQVIGKETIRTVHLRQRGLFRRGDKWLPLVAEQYFTTNSPVFLWYGELRLAPLMTITWGDTYSEGKGHFVMNLLSLFTVVDACGPELDQAELQRYMSEMIWFPTAWLSHYIEWKAVDPQSVKATIRHQGITAAGVMHFNQAGQFTHFTAEHYYDEGHGRFNLRQWSPKAMDYREVSGFRIPMKFEGVWNLESGEYSYIRADITEIEYNK